MLRKGNLKGERRSASGGQRAANRSTGVRYSVTSLGRHGNRKTRARMPGNGGHRRANAINGFAGHANRSAIQAPISIVEEIGC